jgi:PD-(D/E)XK nuclease superfamily
MVFWGAIFKTRRSSMKKEMTYSFSKIDTYSRCPRSFKIIYLDQIPRTKSEALEIGTALHGMVADYLNRLLVLGHSTDWEWARGATPKNGLEDLGQIWQQFYESFTLPQGLDAPGVEKQLAFDRKWQPCEYFSNEAYFRMVIDFHFRQDRLGVIVDWKTNRLVPQTVDKDLQLLTYGWGLKQALYHDVEEVLLRLHFLRYSKECEILPTPGDLSVVPDELSALIQAIEWTQATILLPDLFVAGVGSRLIVRSWPIPWCQWRSWHPSLGNRQ